VFPQGRNAQITNPIPGGPLLHRDLKMQHLVSYG
jgi:hypothetical protein